MADLLIDERAEMRGACTTSRVLPTPIRSATGSPDPGACCRPSRHWREAVDLLDGVVVFASAWFDRPMRDRLDIDWPDVGLYLDGSGSGTAIVCSPRFRPPVARRPRSQIVIYPWPDLGAPRDSLRFRPGASVGARAGDRRPAR
jgi:hypothetical protein